MRPPDVSAVAPTLADGDVIVRGHRLEDVPAVVRLGSDPEMVRWTRVPVPYEPADGEEFVAGVLANWKQGTAYAFAIEVAGEYRGNVELRDRGKGGVEVGYSLSPEMRGKGVMGRALRLALTWGFEALELEVVLWQAQVGNWASRRVAWATGFRVEGTVRGLLPQRDGSRADGWIGSLRRGEEFVPAHAWLDPPTLSGGGAVLRPHTDADVPRIVEACRDEAIRRWIPRIPWGANGYTTEDAEDHLLQIRTEQASGRAVYWAITEGGGHLLGEVGVFVRDPGGHTGEVGYWTHPGGRGRGLTTAAVRLAARHALLPVEDGGLGMDRLLLRAAGGNTASRRVAERAGFTRAGLDRRAERLGDGTIEDNVRYDLLPEELPAPSDPRAG